MALGNRNFSAPSRKKQRRLFPEDPTVWARGKSRKCYLHKSLMITLLNSVSVLKLKHSPDTSEGTSIPKHLLHICTTTTGVLASG